MRYFAITMAIALSTAFLSSGCATTREDASLITASHEEGPKHRPDDSKWKRKPVPLPPLYAKFTSGSGNRWTMITPLYWQVEGRGRSRKTLFPIMTSTRDQVAERKGGYFLNWAWKDTPRKSQRVFFPFYWKFESEDADTSIYGPLYVRKEHDERQRQRVHLFRWLYSRETDATGYDYWGVLFRLVGYEKQIIEGRQRERLWLFFVFPINVS